jgi:hypothetical protein
MGITTENAETPAKTVVDFGATGTTQRAIGIRTEWIL